jgi:hypothetical protein
MSASLMVLIPLVLLGLVTTSCFVGCAGVIGIDPWEDPPLPPSPYQSAVSGHPDCVACWPLADTTEAPTPDGALAVDITTNKINLNYTAPTADSVKLRQTQIVPGDAGSACALFNGGFAQIKFDSRLNPSGSFSIEAWVQPEWKLDDPGVVHIVVASNDPNGFTGYQLHATAENHWAASVGTSQQFVIAKPDLADPPTVKPGEPNYLVATFNAVTGTLSLYVNGSLSVEATIPVGMSFSAAGDPIPFAIAILPASPGTDTKPQFSFNGEIQDVAFYKAVLTQGTIDSHFGLGSA